MDSLSLLRSALVAKRPPVLTTTDDPTSAPDHQTDSLVDAAYLYFSYPSASCAPLNAITRVISRPEGSTEPIDVNLRSVYFAWLQKDDILTDYLDAIEKLNDQLPNDQKIQPLRFLEKVELVTWLEGAQDTSEYVKPLEGDAAVADAANKAADVAGGVGVPTVSGSGVGVQQQSASGRPIKVIDARLQAIYNGERKMGDHNTVLRGIKPTDFSHVRKHAETFLGRRKPASSSRPGQPSRPTQLANRPAQPISKPNQSAVSSKRADPIIMLSPSASSLLRMSNIKSFLDNGVFVPFDHPELASQSNVNLLHITHTIRSLSDKPFRFILVDSPEQFKPEYWERVVAVFTTGQTWQFRGYKWQQPQQLFANVLGIYVGERGLPVPNEVKAWGSNVKTFMLDRWDERSQGIGVSDEERRARRWRDREIVDEVWRSVERSMAARGTWKR